jgi:hypothetical protein
MSLLMKIHRRKFLISLFAFVMILSPFTLIAAEVPGEQQPQSEEPAPAMELGYGVGSVLANFFYMPAKITYAGLGLMTGGLGYVVSAGRADVANNIIYPAVRGNYVITPSHLRGEQPVIFIGAPPLEDSQRQEAPAPQPAPPG